MMDLLFALSRTHRFARTRADEALRRRGYRDGERLPFRDRHWANR